MSCVNDNLTPLGRLIDAAQKDLGWSNRELERQAGDLRGLGKSNIAKLKRESPAALKAETIRNLARLLRVPEATVVKAALESMGVEHQIARSRSLEEAVKGDLALSPRDKRVLLATVTAMKEAGDGDELDPAPMNEGERGSSTVTDLGGERRRRDDWAFGHRVRGDLGVPPVPEVYAAYESPSEGKARWEEDQARGEESQLPPEDDE